MDPSVAAATFISVVAPLRPNSLNYLTDGPLIIGHVTGMLQEAIPNDLSARLISFEARLSELFVEVDRKLKENTAGISSTIDSAKTSFDAIEVKFKETMTELEEMKSRDKEFEGRMTKANEFFDEYRFDGKVSKSHGEHARGSFFGGFG